MELLNENTKAFLNPNIYKQIVDLKIKKDKLRESFSKSKEPLKKKRINSLISKIDAKLTKLQFKEVKIKEKAKKKSDKLKDVLKDIDKEKKEQTNKRIKDLADRNTELINKFNDIYKKSKK